METRVEFRATILDGRRVTPPPAAQSSDVALVRAAQQGSRDAFGELYDRYARMVHGILLAKVPAGEVDDLVHEVFLRALRHLPTLRDVPRFGAWLATITRNCANDFYRRRKDDCQLTEESGEDETRNLGIPSAGETEARLALDAIQSLPDSYREILILRLVEGMTGPEIAARTGYTSGSVRVVLCRGMQQLREKLGHGTPSAKPSASAPGER
jgi:RNA polymerase sigma-70 factor (ECF subfamily)